MAINVSIPTKFGFDATYWKVGSQSFDWVNDISSTNLLGYYDEEARRSGAQHIMELKYSWNGPEFPYTESAMATGNPIKIAYEMIKRSALYKSDPDVITKSEYEDNQETNPFALGKDV